MQIYYLTEMYYLILPFMEVEVQKGVHRAMFLLKTLGKNIFPCLEKLLETTYCNNHIF